MYAATKFESLPDVLGTLGTIRKRFHALNYGADAAAAAAAAPAAAKSPGGGGKANGGKRRS